MHSPEDLQKPNVSSEEFAWDMLYKARHDCSVLAVLITQ